MTDSEKIEWRRLCGLAVELCGSQEKFRRESAVLKRLVKQYGSEDVERMLRGAKKLGWTSLLSLGSAEGLGRRMAIQQFWKAAEKEPVAESVRDIFKGWGK